MFIWATAIVIDWAAAVALFIDSFLSWFLQIGSVLIVFSFCFFRVQDTYRSWSTSLWVKDHPVLLTQKTPESKQKQTKANKSKLSSTKVTEVVIKLWNIHWTVLQLILHQRVRSEEVKLLNADTWNEDNKGKLLSILVCIVYLYCRQSKESSRTTL